jgi:opine dehydrogenase
MRLAVLGAGAIGPASACIAAARGHAVTIWSPSGRGTEGLPGTLQAEGRIEGEFAVEVAAALDQALEGAEAALLAVPAYAYPALIPRIAAALPAHLPLILSPAAALAPVWLDLLLAARGAAPDRAPIGAMATTPCGARRLGPGRVRIGMIRGAVEVAALPAAAAPAIARLVQDLFGIGAPLAPDVLFPALANINPIAHAVLALTNATRIERAEDWPQYAMMTPAACRLMAAMEAERAALAAAFGHALPGLATALHRANGVALASLAEMTANIAAARPEVRGPNSMATRYVTEDVPHGLSAWLDLAASKGVAMPVTEAAVRLLSLLWDQDLRASPVLEEIDLPALPRLLRDGAGRLARGG